MSEEKKETMESDRYEEKKEEIRKQLEHIDNDKWGWEDYSVEIELMKEINDFEQLVKSQAEQDLRKEIEKEINKLSIETMDSAEESGFGQCKEEILKIVNKKEEAKEDR